MSIPFLYFFNIFFIFLCAFAQLLTMFHPFHGKSHVFCCAKQVSHNIFLYFLFFEIMCLRWQLLKPAVSILKSRGRRATFAQGIKSREISAQGNKLPGDNAQGSRGDGCLARFDLNLPSNRFELFWVTKLFPYLVQSLFAYLHCFSAVCATKLPSLS